VGGIDGKPLLVEELKWRPAGGEGADWQDDPVGGTEGREGAAAVGRHAGADDLGDCARGVVDADRHRAVQDQAIAARRDHRVAGQALWAVVGEAQQP
jgi:hypothetical protein